MSRMLEIQLLLLLVVFRIFCESTGSALQTIGPQNEQLPNWEGTFVFVKTILKFWNIVNVKSS